VVYDYFQIDNNAIKGDVVKIIFNNINLSPTYETKQQHPTKYNYFIGNDPTK